MFLYSGDASFFFSFLKNPEIKDCYLFYKDVAEFKIRINEEKIKNSTLIFVGDVAEVEEILFHSGFYGKIEYLFVHFRDDKKREEIEKILSFETDYVQRCVYLRSLYNEIMEGRGDFFVYSPKVLKIKTTENVVLKDISYFPFFTKRSVLKDEDALIEKTYVYAKNPDKVFISDNKENFIIRPM